MTASPRSGARTTAPVVEADVAAPAADVISLAPRKREQTKLANRQAILDAARRVFSAHGYEAASVRDVIRQSGLSVGAFYNYFRSKEEVYQALADDGARRFKLILREAWSQAESFETFLRTALRAFFAFQLSEQDAWAGRGETGHPQIRVETPEQRAVFEEVRVVLAEVIGRGAAPRVDPDFLAAACIGVAREICERLLARPTVDLEGATDFAFRMIMGGMAELRHLEEPPA